MFEGFFYRLRGLGIPISPTSFLQLQKALATGCVASLEDFYVVARSLMIKRERHFDLYDRVFAHYFEGKELDEDLAGTLAAELQQLLSQWLQDPAAMPFLTAEEREKIKKMTPEELEQYFLQRLREQTSRHDGGNRWIGTGGTSPLGHSGQHPSGLRIGGVSGGRSAIKVALERRYIDYSESATLTAEHLGDALSALKYMAPAGPKDKLNIDKTIYETVRQAGEIELVFDRDFRDKLSVFLFIDNGGWSMNPFVKLTRALFTQAQGAFKRLRTFFFHNCIYDVVWEDPQRYLKPVRHEELMREDAQTRLIVVGDASMGPYELVHARGAIDWTTDQHKAGHTYLEELTEHFPHHVWINPIPLPRWDTTYGAYTIEMVREIFPMVDLTLGGIEKAVTLLRGH